MNSRAAVQTADRAIEMQSFAVPEQLDPMWGLLEVEASGMCGTDYEQYRGDWAKTGLIEYPVIPGHEPVGRIAALGDGAGKAWGLEVGQRVAVEAVVPCGVCRECTSGRTRLCRNRFRYGFTETPIAPSLWGGYAEYMMLRPNTILHRVPDELSIEDAVYYNPLAAGFDWACRAAGTEPGDTVLILGCGSRGIASVIAVREAGAERVIVTGLSRDRAKLDLALELGASDAVDVEAVDLVAYVEEVTGGEMADRVVDVTPYATQPIVDAIDCVRPAGTIVLAGVKGMREVPGFISDKVFIKELTITGVFGVGSWANQQALRVIASGRHPIGKLHSHTLTIDRLEYAMRLLGGEVEGEEALHVTVTPR